jgi:hypothetical protein
MRCICAFLHSISIPNIVPTYWTMNIASKPFINTANMEHMAAEVEFPSHLIDSDCILTDRAGRIS